jgi:FMN phosphatase YigB (HAD superfamily)
MQSPEIVVCDLNGTLVTANHSDAADRYLAEQLGVDLVKLQTAQEKLAPKALIGRFPRPFCHPDLQAFYWVYSLYKQLSDRFLTEAELLKIMEGYQARWAEPIKFYPGVPTSLHVLRALLRVAVCTNGTAIRSQAVTSRIKLAGQVDAIVGSYEAGERKPLPAIYRTVLRRFGLPQPPDLPAGLAVWVDDDPDCCLTAAEQGFTVYMPMHGGSNAQFPDNEEARQRAVAAGAIETPSTLAALERVIDQLLPPRARLGALVPLGHVGGHHARP